MAEAIPETIQDNPRITVTINIGDLKISSILHVYDDIFDVRQKVFDEFNIAIEEQIIKHGGRVIGDEEIVYAIYKDPAVDIEWENPLSLKIKSNNLTQGGTFDVSVPRSVKIFSMLDLIRTKIELRCYEFYLVWSGTTLDNIKSISDYDIQNEDVLEVHVRGDSGMTVFVKTSPDKLYRIPFSPDQYVREFKKSVCDKLGINEAIFNYDFRSLEDDELMGFYNIQSDDKIDVYFMRGGENGVRCMYNSNRMKFYFDYDDPFPKVTIRELKEKISKEIEKSANKFTIKYNRTEFTDLNKTLKQYLIDLKMTLNIKDTY